MFNDSNLISSKKFTNDVNNETPESILTTFVDLFGKNGQIERARKQQEEITRRQQEIAKLLSRDNELASLGVTSLTFLDLE